MRKKHNQGQYRDNPSPKPLFLVLSGPSGVGKDTILARMKELGLPLSFITTVTTRQRRPTERNAVDYRFVSTERFQEMLAENELLEWAKVYGNYYGVPKQAVKQALEKGRDAIVRVDVQGAASIKKILPQAVFIFIMPPSVEESSARLKARSTETVADLDLRLKTAREEIAQLPLFDYIVVSRSGEIDRAVVDIQTIITAEKCRVVQREISL
ncbi:MAG: guanylate kinase [Chloroflexota bacterium]